MFPSRRLPKKPAAAPPTASLAKPDKGEKSEPPEQLADKKTEDKKTEEKGAAFRMLGRLAKSRTTGSSGTGSACSGGLQMDKKEANLAFMEMVGRQLSSYNWYHGIMPRQEGEALLKKDGDFLIRKTTIKNETSYCLSAKTDGEFKHLPITYNDRQWHLCGESRATLDDLLVFFIKKGDYMGKSGAIIKKQIPRPDYYLPNEIIRTDKKLGSGAYGEVHKGALLSKEGAETKVAIKTMKGKVSKDDATKFVREARLMRKCRHENIVGIYGVTYQEEPMMIVIELAEMGELKEYVEKNRDSIPPDRLYSFVRDAARGMCYLSRSMIIHRDLAARNCLLGAGLCLKISDFGLSMEVKKEQPEIKMAKLTKVPIKWSAPETLRDVGLGTNKGIYSTKSDVWSFGIMTWEIYSLCKTEPFPAMTNGQAKEKILSGEVPMQAPQNSPEIIKNVLMSCFQKDSDQRMDFLSLLRMLAPYESPPNPTDVLDQ